MRDLSPVDIRKALDSDQAPFLLDVRERWEWDLVHLDEATLIPMNTVPDRLAELPRDREIAVLCHHGSRSRQVALYLQQEGFGPMINVAGGIEAWAIEVDATLGRY